MTNSNSNGGFCLAPTAENPDRFTGLPPTEAELADITIDTIIKVCHSGERFHATVTTIDGDNITAVVDDLLHNVELFNIGDTIHVEKRHVFQVNQEFRTDMRSRADPAGRREMMLMFRQVLNPRYRAQAQAPEQPAPRRSNRRHQRPRR